MKDLVTLAMVEEGIALLTLQDEEKKNSFYGDFIDQLIARLGELAGLEEARVCIFRGLPDVFSSGANRDLLLELAEGKQEASDIVLPKVVMDLPIPTIAAMEGHAIGGGLALGLCCDVILAARKSRYCCSFMNMGFTPGMGITRLLELAVGPYVAAEMMFGGQFFKGSHFDKASGFNYVLPRDEVYPKALELARRIAEKPRPALTALKRYLSLPRRQAFEETLTAETFMHQLCFAEPETVRRIRENYTPDAAREKK